MSSIQDKIDFILELEKLKAVLRKTKPVGLDRYENSAEHSWQTALTALVLLDENKSGIDAFKVVKMLLIHDVVEIDVGDVFVYDTEARAEIAQHEEVAARRIFGMLPDPIGSEFLDIWLEFEARESRESQFAKAVDRVNPVLQNLSSKGQSWVENDIPRDRVLAENREIGNASFELWSELEGQIQNSEYLPD